MDSGAIEKRDLILPNSPTDVVQPDGIRGLDARYRQTL